MSTKNRYNEYWKLGRPEYNTGIYTYNAHGELEVHENGNVYNLHELVKKYDSPLRVFIPSVVTSRVAGVYDAFERAIKQKKYSGSFEYHYPMKSNQTKEAVEAVLKGGAHIEVTSANELVRIGGLWKKGKTRKNLRVLCNGPKSEAYRKAILHFFNEGMAIVPIIENQAEFTLFDWYPGELGIRVDLDITVDSHWNKDLNRFGLSEEEVYALPTRKNLTVFHFHVGSQVGTGRSLLSAVKHGASVYKKLRETQPALSIFDMGGGFTVPYTKNKKLYDPYDIADGVVRILKQTFPRQPDLHPDIVVEWGQYAVAPSQCLIYKVIFEKDIPKAEIQKKWYIVDGSFMNDLTDTWSIGQTWHILPVNNVKNKLTPVWLAGSSCDSDDEYRVDDLELPKIAKNGEPLYIAVLDTGAYQEALAGNHCLLGNPAKISLQKGNDKLIYGRDVKLGHLDWKGK